MQTEETNQNPGATEIFRMPAADATVPDLMAQRLIDLDRRIGQLEKAAQGDIPPTAQQVAARQRKH